MSKSSMSISRRAAAMLFVVALSSPVPGADRFEVAWRQRFGSAVLAPLSVMPGEVLTATVSGDVVRILAGDGRILQSEHVHGPLADIAGAAGFAATVAIDDTVSILGWGSATLERELCMPAARSGSATVASGMLLVPLADSTLLAVNLTQGSIAWRRLLPGRVRHPPAVARGRILTASSSGDVTLLTLADGNIHARARMPAARMPAARMPAAPEPIVGIAGDLALVGAIGERMAGLSLSNAARQWSADIGRGAAAPIVDAGDIGAGESAGAIVSTGANQLLLLKRNGSPRWRISLPGRVRLTPQVIDGTVWVVPERLGRLIGYDLVTGAETGALRLGSSLEWMTSAPVAAAGTLCLATSRGDVIGVRRSETPPAAPRPLAGSAGVPPPRVAPAASTPAPGGIPSRPVPTR